MKATAGHPQICWLFIAATNRWKTQVGGEVSNTIYGMYELFTELETVTSVYADINSIV